jgi:hypothetical protein
MILEIEVYIRLKSRLLDFYSLLKEKILGGKNIFAPTWGEITINSPN